MKNFFTRLGLFLEKHKQTIFLAGVVLEFLLVGALTLSLLIAFWLMGIPYSKWNFPMQIGVSAVVGICGGIGSLWALYKSISTDIHAQTDRYKMDSIFNSEKGKSISSEFKGAE